MKYESRRSFLSKTIELAAAVPLVTLVCENFRNRTSYYEIDDSEAKLAQSPNTELGKIAKLNSNLNGSLENLCENYRLAYHIRHTRMVPYTYKVGKSTCRGMRSETYYRWEEPTNVPNHSVVNSWKELHSNFSSKISEVSRDAQTDLDKLGKLKVVSKKTGENSEGLASLGIYVPQIAALLFYEEAIALAKHGDEKHTSVDELVERHDTIPQITRRSFLKVGAALAGALVSFPIVADNKLRREEGKIKLEGEIEKMGYLAKAKADNVFSQYFGLGVKELIVRYHGQLKLSEKTIENGIANSKVRDAFVSYIHSQREYNEPFEGIFSEGIPAEVEYAIKSSLISQNLRDKSQSEHKAVYIDLGLTGLAVAGTMAASLIPLEVANEYYANKVEKAPVVKSILKR